MYGCAGQSSDLIDEVACWTKDALEATAKQRAAAEKQRANTCMICYCRKATLHNDVIRREIADRSDNSLGALFGTGLFEGRVNGDVS